MNELRIPYKPNKMIFITGIAFSGIGAGLMGYVAATNDRGLILNGILEFSPQGATIFYLVMAAAATAFVLIAFLALAKFAVSEREIVISEFSITAPKSGLSKLDITVNFSDITDISIQTIQKTKILNIDHTGGKLSIPNSMLPSEQAFDGLVSELQSKLNG